MRFNEQNIKSILTIDAKAAYDENRQYAGVLTVEEHVRKYIKSNKELYTVALNLYLILIQDLVDDRSSIEVSDFIKANGFIAAIRQLAAVADSFIQGNLTTDYWNEHLVHKILGSDRNEAENVRLLLYILTFFKKLSPSGMQILERKELQSLLETNDVNRANSMSTKYGYWTKKMKEKLNPILQKAIKAHKCFGSFSSGSTSHSSKTVNMKLNELSKTVYSLYDCPLYALMRKDELPVDYVELRAPAKESFTRWYRDDVSDAYKSTFYKGLSVVDYNRCCRIMAVPKTYKSRRIIAPEPAVRAFDLQAKRKTLEYAILGDYRGNIFKDVFHLDDQSVNQWNQQFGSATNLLTTFDFSHASDMITHDLVSCVTSPDVYTWLSELNADFLLVDDYCVPSWIFCTAGNPICFNLEGLIFSSLALAVYDVYTTITQEKDLIGPFVYGDDVIVDVRVAESFRDAATSIGWLINEKKTYSDGPYRESCGAESWKGIDISTKKWPRHEYFSSLDEKQNRLEFANGLIEMQHRVYSISWYAQKYLRDYVLDMFPRVTIGEPHTETPDLWGPDVTYGRRAFPAISGDALLPDEFARYYAKCPAVKTPKRTGEMNLFERYNYAMYVYTQYLQNGPSYEDPLLELLHVSQSRIDYDSAMNTGAWTLSLIERP